MTENYTEIQVGDVIKAKVIKVEEKQVIVDFGYKFDGIIPISELSHLHVEHPNEVVSEGQEIEAKVKKIEDDAVVLSKRDYDREKAWQSLINKKDKQEIVDATVIDIVNGGLVVDVGLRAFMPASHVELHFVEDFSDYKGKTLRLKVIEMDKEKNKLILSQRAVLDEEAEELKRQTLEKIQPGDIIEGTVQRLTDFGVFVDIGGVDGLVHISQMAHYHVETPSEVVNEGDKINVKVLSVDPENERISLSIKETLPGPWEEIEGKINPGDVVEGTVKRLVSFGAFVEVAPGVEGLVHISQIANRHIGTPSEVLKEGETIKAKVLDVNIEDKRISLSIRALEEEKEAKMEKEVKQQYKKEEEQSGFSLGEMIGDQLKKLQ